MILSCSNISKSFADNCVISGGSFHIEEGQKAAIVGINGAGKSTLLKIIIGDILPDEGIVSISKDADIGYLAQHQAYHLNVSIYDYVLSKKQHVIDIENKIKEIEAKMPHMDENEALSKMPEYNLLLEKFNENGGYSYKGEVIGTLKGLGFKEEEFNRGINELSGGELTRVSLAALLISSPKLLILDEPTNHLDIDSVTWLENYIKSYKGAVLIVSHDRYFLNKIVSKVIELSNGKISQYDGSYDDYSKKSAKKRLTLLKAYLNQQEEIKRQEQVIDKLKSFNREKSVKRAQSRQKALDKMDIIKEPEAQTTPMKLSLNIDYESGKDVLRINNLSKSYNGNYLFKDISFEIKRNQRVAIIGSNGTGKTTLLRIINNLTNPDSGSVDLGAKVNIGYYDQQQHVLDDNKTIFEEIQDAYPNLTNTQIRNTLAAFLFFSEDVFKKISELSGGEKGRVALAKLTLSGANFLILDEPTNHLDIPSKEVLEDALKNYPGTVLFVSHDRYFINEIATSILHLNKTSITKYLGNYDYYLEKKRDIESNNNIEIIHENKTQGKIKWQKDKANLADARKRQAKINKIEKQITSLEDEINNLNDKLNLPQNSTNSAKLNEISALLEYKNKELESLMNEWESIFEN